MLWKCYKLANQNANAAFLPAGADSSLAPQGAPISAMKMAEHMLKNAMKMLENALTML